MVSPLRFGGWTHQRIPDLSRRRKQDHHDDHLHDTFLQCNMIHALSSIRILGSFMVWNVATHTALKCVIRNRACHLLWTNHPVELL